MAKIDKRKYGQMTEREFMRKHADPLEMGASNFWTLGKISLVFVVFLLLGIVFGLNTYQLRLAEVTENPTNNQIIRITGNVAVKGNIYDTFKGSDFTIKGYEMGEENDLEYARFQIIFFDSDKAEQYELTLIDFLSNGRNGPSNGDRLMIQKMYGSEWKYNTYVMQKDLLTQRWFPKDMSPWGDNTATKEDKALLNMPEKDITDMLTEIEKRLRALTIIK